eukprot:11216144-Lingulodinium_polyedra.AAC.1
MLCCASRSCRRSCVSLRGLRDRRARASHGVRCVARAVRLPLAFFARFSRSAAAARATDCG